MGILKALLIHSALYNSISTNLKDACVIKPLTKHFSQIFWFLANLIRKKKSHCFNLHFSSYIEDNNSVQFSSVTQSCPTLCDPMDWSTPGLLVHHQLLELAQIHVHWVCDAIQPSHPLSSPSPPTFNHSHHQGIFQWVSSLHQMTRGLEFQLHHQSFQWIFRTDFL